MTNNNNIDNQPNDIELKIDWFQVSFDFIPITFNTVSNKYIIDTHNPKLRELIEILNPKTDLIKTPYDEYINYIIRHLEQKKGRFRFSNGFYIGEHIELSYGGNKTLLDTYPMVLIMSGSACREFELSGGDWDELFRFILDSSSSGYLKVGRFDIALDDFVGDIISPYMLEPYFRNHHYISPFRNIKYYITEKHGDTPETTGFSITLGSKGSTEIQYYDKLLERRNSDTLHKDLNVWYRLETRFYEAKAREVLERYLNAKTTNDSVDFMVYMKQILKGLLDIKEENPNDSRKARWNTLPAWDYFLGNIEKVDLRKDSKIETTIERKVEWTRNSLANHLLQLKAVKGSDFNNFINEIMVDAEPKTRHLEVINSYNKSKKKQLITFEDLSDIQKGLSDIEILTTKQVLIQTLDRLNNHLPGYLFAGAGDEEYYFAIHDELYYYKVVDEETYLDSSNNSLYVSTNDVDNWLKLSVILKKEIRRLNNPKERR